jgi:RNA recognition motif-containing protein
VGFEGIFADFLTFSESETDTMEKEADPSSEEISQSAPAPSSVPAAPKNWANLVKGGPSLSFNSPPLPELPAAPQPQSFVAITQQQQQQAQQQKVQGENFANTERRPMRTNNERERRTSGSTYNNSQEGNNQLFLGNLPTRATEEELRQMFSVFGKISDLRIHNKPQQKNSQNRPVPNYGFITFEDPASALKLQDSQVG